MENMRVNITRKRVNITRKQAIKTLKYSQIVIYSLFLII